MEMVELPWHNKLVTFTDVTKSLVSIILEAPSKAKFFVPGGQLQTTAATVKTCALKHISADTKYLHSLLSSTIQRTLFERQILILPWTADSRHGVVAPDLWIRMVGNGQAKRRREEDDDGEDLAPAQKLLRRAGAAARRIQDGDPTQGWQLDDQDTSINAHPSFLSRRTKPSDLKLAKFAADDFQATLAAEFSMEDVRHRLGFYVACIASEILPHVKIVLPRDASSRCKTRTAIAQLMASSEATFGTPTCLKGVKERIRWIEAFLLGWLCYLGVHDRRWVAKPENVAYNALRIKLGEYPNFCSKQLSDGRGRQQGNQAWPLHQTRTREGLRQHPFQRMEVRNSIRGLGSALRNRTHCVRSETCASLEG